MFPHHARPGSGSSIVASRRPAAGSSRRRPSSRGSHARLIGRSSAGSSSAARDRSRPPRRARGPSLIALTHASHFDFSAIRLALAPRHRRRISAAAAADYFATQALALVHGRLARGLRVQPYRPRRGLHRRRLGLLAARSHVVLFPEARGLPRATSTRSSRASRCWPATPAARSSRCGSSDPAVLPKAPPGHIGTRGSPHRAPIRPCPARTPAHSPPRWRRSSGRSITR